MSKIAEFRVIGELEHVGKTGIPMTRTILSANGFVIAYGKWRKASSTTEYEKIFNLIRNRLKNDKKKEKK